MSMGRAIILDLFGTILNDVSNDYKKGIEWLCRDVLTAGTSTESAMEVAGIFKRENMKNRANTHREASMLKELELFKERIGFKRDLSLADIEFDFFNASRQTSLADGLIDLLEYLQAKRVSVFVMSNTIFSAETIRRHLDLHGLLKYISGVFTSGDCGYRKPGYRFFTYTFKEIQKVENVKCEDVIFVGNSLEKDMLGSRRFGFIPVWISSEAVGIGEKLADCDRVENLCECKEYIESNFICVAGISKNYSVSDGVGNRIVVYLQGCDLQCDRCHNKSTWNPTDGKFVNIHKLVSDTLRSMSSRARNVTISGGEPTMQKKALLSLLTVYELAGVDICLYTGHEFEAVPEEIKRKVHYLKTGPFVHALKTTTKGFYGSTNQKFWEKEEDGKWAQRIL